MADLFMVFIAACLVNNLVLDHLVGVGPLLSVSRSVKMALGLSGVMMLVLPLTSLACALVNQLVLAPLDLSYLQPLVFVLIIIFITSTGQALLLSFRPELHQRYAIFVPLVLVNTSVLGVALLAVQQEHGLLLSIIFALGMACGFALVMGIISGLRDRIRHADLPRAFRGTSIMLITLGILSMAFMGFVGTG